MMTITSGLAAAPIPQPASYDYAMLGNSMTLNGAVAVEARGSTALLQRMVGTTRRSVAVVPLASRLAFIGDDDTNTCAVITSDFALTTASATNFFGNGNRCAQPCGAYLPGRADMLLAAIDTLPSSLDVNVATLNADGSLTNLGAVVIAQSVTDPRAVAVSDGYWLSFQQAGELVAAHVGFAPSSMPATIVLGPLSDNGGHALVTLGDSTYATWLYNGNVFVTKLC
jgi:hypothetical protein